MREDVNLPSRWAIASIADVTLPFETIDPTKEPMREFTYIDIGSIDNKRLCVLGPKQFLGKDAPSRARRTVRVGDTLFSTVRPYLRNITLISDEHDACLTSTGICILRPSKCIDAKYLFYWASHREFVDNVSKSMDGTMYPAIRDTDVYSQTIKLPPLAEQQCIVAKLDALIERNARAREELAHIPKLVKCYKQAILTAAFSGELTTDWRERHPNVEPACSLLGRISKKFRTRRVQPTVGSGQTKLPSLPSTWCWSYVEDIGDVALGRQRSPENHTGPHMRSYVRAGNITWNGWDLSDLKEMNFNGRDFEKFRLEPGDVLVNEGSGSPTEVGKPAVWQGEIENCCFQNTLIRVRPYAQMTDFLYFQFLYAALSGLFVSYTRGVNIHHIGREGLARFLIAVPPLTEQEEIVTRIKKCFAMIGKCRAETRRVVELLDCLDQQILAKAFRGELIPQDPNDEPASILLERIRAERRGSSKGRS